MNKDELWQTYISEQDVLNNLAEEFIVAGSKTEVAIALTKNYKTSQAELKKILDHAFFKKLNTRFRAYCHRIKTQKSTIAIDKYTLDRFDKLKAKMKLDNYSDVFEYLLKPDGQYAEEIKAFFNDPNNNARFLSIEESFKTLYRLMYLEHQTLLKQTLEMQFENGWMAAKRSKRKTNAELDLEKAQAMQLWCD